MAKISKDITIIRPNGQDVRSDFITIEEPLEILIKYYQKGTLKSITFSITMRTPGNDEELATGFMFAEGIISKASDIVEMKSRGPMLNTLEVFLHPEMGLDENRFTRFTLTSSSCGVCGKTSIDFVNEIGVYIHRPALPKLSHDVIFKLASSINKAATSFNDTGGIHAAFLFSSKGELLDVREDVGRHNAMDKLVGHALMTNNIPLKDSCVLLSGRTSFELIQKAHMAGLSIVLSVGAPSSLAIEMAEDNGMTLIGFLKDDRFNVYVDKGRVVPSY